MSYRKFLENDGSETISFSGNFHIDEPTEIIIPIAFRVWKLFKLENDSAVCDKEWVSCLFSELDKIYGFLKKD